MIRGVNRRIIEIKRMDSEYFEGAIFFVKDSKAQESTKKLEKQAELVLHNFCAIKYKKKSIPPIAYRAARAVSLASAGIAFVMLAIH